MAFDYSALRNTAITLINKFGRTATRRVVTNSGSEFDPTQTNVDTPIVGAFVGFSNREIDGTLILATDKKMISYDSVAIDDKIIDASIKYVVKNVDTINPGDTVLIYKIQLRV